MSRTFRSITLAATLLVLCSSATYARPSAGWLAPEGLLAAMWGRVVAWFAPEVTVTLGEKAGSQMDPNGAPSTASDDLRIYDGGYMDEDGHK
ncbi:MAG TPA: hypothetical protein VLE27_01290 [Thermoanaerobaculia bacterium]|nr:hypothetical protein [Thermoanaerobaculia bacterium]